jgi:DNA repair photolyase
MNSAPSLPLNTVDARVAAHVRGVDYVDMPVKQILNRCTSPRMPFRWTINPYRGCEFGCVYCYARYTHDFLELHDPMDFERRIFVKQTAGEVLRRTLSRVPVGADQIALGTATDPYQPAERKFELTRSILEVFAQAGGLNLSITTKSALISRDLDLLQEINRRSQLSVNFSLITLNRRLQRLLEPRAPRSALRLAAMKQLTGAGIRCNLLMAPMIPGLTDAPAAIEGVIRAARRAGASDVWWRSLFLKPAAARRFLPFIKGNFPEDQQRLTEWYSRSAYPPRSYDDSLRPIFDRLRRKYGFHSHSGSGDHAELKPASAPFTPSTPRNVQLWLLNRLEAGESHSSDLSEISLPR